MTHSVLIGDRVAFSASWLKALSIHTGPIPFARGTVRELVDLGSTTLAVVDWGGDPEVPVRVSVDNLVPAAEHGIAD